MTSENAESSEPDTQLVARMRTLIELQSESRSLDYKGPMAFDSRRTKGELIKCLMAFSNTQDGGHILIGVDQTATGFIATGISDDESASWDPTSIGDLARRLCSELPRFRVFSERLDGRLLVLIEVLPFENEPLVCIRNYDDEDGRRILREASVYVRTHDAKCAEIGSATDMRELIGLAARRRNDDVVRQVRDLVGGPPASTPDPPDLPFREELQSSIEFFVEQAVDGPHWQFVVRPAGYSGARTDRRGLLELRRNAEVSIRGWNLPHTDRDHGETRVHEGIQSWTNFGRYIEAHRMYMSGLFAWRRLLWEDLDERTPSGVLSYVSAIWSLTEQLVFAGRWASTLFPEDAAVVDWEITGLDGRRLWVEPGSGIYFSLPYECHVESLTRAIEVPSGELRAGSEDLALDWLQELFQLFQADVGRPTLRDWQLKFLERRF